MLTQKQNSIDRQPATDEALECFERIFLGKPHDALDKARALIAVLQEIEVNESPNQNVMHGHYLVLTIMDVLVAYGQAASKP